MKRIRAVLVLFAAIVLLVVGCSGGTSSPADPLFRQGDEYLRQQDYEVAMQALIQLDQDLQPKHDQIQTIMRKSDYTSRR